MLKNIEKVTAAVEYIKQQTNGFIPKVGIILGSGLGPLADDLTDSIQVSYNNIPHFPVSTIAGHAGMLVLGKLSGVPVVCMKGRVHPYEGKHLESIKILIRTLKLLGCERLIITNAAGSLRQEVGAGELVSIYDHIGLFHPNPLVGANDEEFGPRFFPMTNAYDEDLRKELKKTAIKIGIPLHDGVYLATMGPSFETPAEIKAARVLGADLVGMSTIPDVLVARQTDLKVIAISSVTNLAAGMAEEHLTHEGTLHYAQFGGERLRKLLKAFLEDYSNEFSA